MNELEWILLFSWISLGLNFLTLSAVLGLVYKKGVKNGQSKK